jgi:hypothetical protein
LLVIVLSSKHSCSYPSIDTTATMSFPSPPLRTHLDCFAQAIKLISLAAVIDQRITESVPVFAESFVTVSRLPKARSPLSMKISSQDSADSIPQENDSHVVILHKVIRVLTLCTADCPLEVSRLIPLVPVHMIPMQQDPDSFPSTIVDGKHQTCSSGNSDRNKVANSIPVSLQDPQQNRKELLSSGQSSSQEPTKMPAKATPTNSSQGSENKSSKALDAGIYPHPNDIVDLMSPPNSPGHQESTGDTNNSESSSRRSNKKPPSNQAIIGSYSHTGSSSSSQGSSSPSSSVHSLSDASLRSNASSKRRNREDGNSFMKFGHIPKRVKSHESFVAPVVFNKKQGYGIKSTLTFDMLLNRFESWKKFLTYKPSKKCLPSDTFLAVIMTNPVESEVMKSFKGEAGSNADLVAYLSVTKIFLIPRTNMDGFTMSYSIGNLHKYLHGTLHITSEQNQYFKEASAPHLEVKVLEQGEQFDDPHNGIHVKYKDPDRGFNSIHSLADGIIPLMDSSCSSPRKVPGTSIGRSTANAHLYKKENRTNIVGSISPFLIKGDIDDIRIQLRYTIVNIVCQAVTYFSHCGCLPTPFYHSDPNIRAERSKLALQFMEYLIGPDYVRHVHKDKFLAEGISFILNNFVSFHKDAMNDPTPGMNDTLSVQCNIIITKDEITGIKSVKKAMNMYCLEVGDPLSFSVTIYSRKIIRDYIKRRNKISTVMNYPPGGLGNVKVLKHEPNWILDPLLKAIY